MANYKRIGIILPSANNVFEPDIQRLMPGDVSCHTARMPITNVSLLAQEQAEAMKQMEEAMEECARSLATAGMDAMAYACTTGSLLGGLGYDQKVIQRIQDVGSAPAVATSAAVVVALRTLGINKVCVVTPHSEEVNAKIQPFLEGNGFQVISMAGKGLGTRNPLEIGDDPPEDIYDFALDNWDPEADGMFLSCTNWQALDVVEQLEQASGKPVVSSNQATIWTALQMVGYAEPIRGYGQLLSTAAEVLQRRPT